LTGQQTVDRGKAGENGTIVKGKELLNPMRGKICPKRGGPETPWIPGGRLRESKTFGKSRKY